jgi:hypothetical protein
VERTLVEKISTSKKKKNKKRAVADNQIYLHTVLFARNV